MLWCTGGGEYRAEGSDPFGGRLASQTNSGASSFPDSVLALGVGSVSGEGP